MHRLVLLKSPPWYLMWRWQACREPQRADGWTAGRPPTWSHHLSDPITANSRFLLETNSRSCLFSLILSSSFSFRLIILYLISPSLPETFTALNWFSFQQRRAAHLFRLFLRHKAVICLSCLWMTLHGKNESSLESSLFFFSPSQLFSTFLYLLFLLSISNNWNDSFLHWRKNLRKKFLNMCLCGQLKSTD